MNKNVASWDRIVRVVLGAVLLYLAFGGVTSGVLAIVAGIFGIVFLVTAVMGWCPLYALFKVSTNHA